MKGSTTFSWVGAPVPYRPWNEGDAKGLASPPLKLAAGALRLLALFTLTATSSLAATLSQQIDPPEVTVGDEVVVTITVQDGGNAKIHLPQVDGLPVTGTSTAMNMTFNNGALSTAVSESFHLQPQRAGDFTIPAFDLQTADGQTLHAHAMKLHVLAADNPAPANVPAPATAPPANPPYNPNGPVVMPPDNPQNPDNPDDATSAIPGFTIPTEKDGRPAKVFVYIHPDTTDAYVGESVPLRIEWYIRRDCAYQQDSLPTIKGSDFMMNNLSTRPREDELIVMNEPFVRERWTTAISAPRSGDFPLQMERDSYWVKTTPGNSFSFFGGLLNRPTLAHESVPSNQFTMHIHSLPEEGRPANFTGAIGQFTVAGSTQATTVDVGEPVPLHFTVTGTGNFDYVKSPVLADDPAWKSYKPSAKVSYVNESHTEGVKTFEQSIIPQKNGTLPLPAAAFSYFDPSTKQYVTVPVSLPSLQVTGSAQPPAPIATTDASGSPTASVHPITATTDLVPNRLQLGSVYASLLPVNRQTWFWAVQGGMIALLLLGFLLLVLHSRQVPETVKSELLQHQRSLYRQEDSMRQAVRRHDAPAFFMAARQSVLLQLGAQWGIKADALTLAEIRRRDPQMADTLEPLFLQTDEVVYSGQASPNLDLAKWERHVREELLQPQPA